MIYRNDSHSPDGAWVLVADSACKICRGRGSVYESHGEVLDCDCVFESSDPEVLVLIDAGAKFVVEPSPDYIKQMEMIPEVDELPF